ncbi:MAG: efflux RND transporter permease subunit [Deltaproteobacteria bacterium]|nr:efflux RND transporter permease subunit [Deltaproteobacteria bacterium]MBW2354805.1 efflux RND transporter permease subunit [Deltaproteobacteria bacterium]HDZ23518.1 efflux RND transporter permease subunit [Desulfobacteraceae bacterium]
MQKIIQFVLKSRLLILALGAMVLAGGYYSYIHLPVDAFPDVVPTLVQVFTETEGLAPEEVEKYVTYPVEVVMNGLPNLKEIRSVSNFGLSVVNIYFNDGTDIYFARQLVNERLQSAREEIPKGFGEPEMGPISTGLGQILFYFVEDESGKRTPEEMRQIQDWLIKFNLQTVPGVTEALSLGGEVKQFQVLVRPLDLLRFDLTLNDIVEAVKSNNSNVGAQYIVKNSEQYIVRSVGLAREISDLQRIVLRSEQGTPVFLNQVADVVIGGEIRQGLATMDGRGEVVVGMILKLIGTNTSEVIRAVKNKMEEINKILPPGIKVVPYYDQATLVAKCVQTVTKALFEAMGLLVLIQLIMLGGLRPSLVVLASIPFSLAFAFILMNYFGVSANLMSLGGLAIALGLLVDGSVVMVENVDRMLRERGEGEPLIYIVARACTEVLRPIIFSLVIIIIVFLPLFTLQGVEGKTFRPLAQTMSFAMLGSLVFAVLLAPVLASLLMRRPSGRACKHEEFFVVRWLVRFYRPLVTFFVKRPGVPVLLSVGLLGLGVFFFTRLGSEFVPRLNEGDLLVRATMAPSISLDEAKETMLRFERRLMDRFSEVNSVVTRVGRGEVGAHADPVNSAEAFVALRPQSQWTTAENPEELVDTMSKAFENFLGVQFNFTQPIAAAVDELLTGTKAELAIKIFGPDMDILKKKANELEILLRTIPGAADVQKDQVTGTPQLRITIDHDAISRYGVNVGDVQEVIRAAIGGETAGQIFEGIPRFDILVRYTPENRDTKEAIGHILVSAPGGARVPLENLAKIEEIVGPRQITRENNQRFITVQCNVRGRDIGSFVAEAQQIMNARMKFAPGYLVKWGGQFELQQEANKRLLLVIPVTLIIVFLLLFSTFNSLKNSLLILLNIPLALVGGLAALLITGQNLSVPASVGFISLFGIALANGMVLVTYINQLLRNGISMDVACINGACLRLRAVLMTASTTGLGLLPLVLSSGTGSEVQRPLATVVIGGLVTSTALTLLVIPALYRWFAIKPEQETVMK